MDSKGLQQVKAVHQHRTATGRASSDAQPSRSAVLLPVNSRKGADKASASKRKAHSGGTYYKLDSQQATHKSDRCTYCAEKANYSQYCPLHSAIPDYIRLVQEGKTIEATGLCRQIGSLPEIYNRVYPQGCPCGGVCTLKNHSSVVSIGNPERCITDTVLAMGWRPGVSGVVPRSEKVAVIGAGPAGLGCANILARTGVQADTFDHHPEIGGMLTFGIPPFRLDKTVSGQQRKMFTVIEIDSHLNYEISRDITSSNLAPEYNAAFIGAGTYRMMRVDLPHENTPGVVRALSFLAAHTRQLIGLPEFEEYPLTDVKGRRVVVLGGGDTTIDCLRTSIRLNTASVTYAYRRDEVGIPGSRKEVANARKEDVKFQFNVQPQHIVCDRDGRLAAAGLIRTVMGKPRSNGRHRPCPVTGSEFESPADVLAITSGFQAHTTPWLQDSGIKLDKWDLIQTGDIGHLLTRTHLKEVLAGDGAVHGVDLVITAIAAGRQAMRDMLTPSDTEAP